MDRKKYKKTIYTIIILYIAALIFFPTAAYIITKNVTVSLVFATGMAVLCILSYILNKVNDLYISNIIEQLSELIDVLIQIDSKNQKIFLSNEDTILSKLQNKVLKLSKILKNNSMHEKQEHENIKKLVSDISHQLKTPIANLKMYSQFLFDESLPTEKQREYISILHISIERLDFLSENIIKVSRLESGLIHLNMQIQNLNQTVLKAVKDIYVKAQHRCIEIKYSEENQIDLKHDRNWTAEAIFNLLDNAVKYGQNGNIIHLSIRNLGIFVEVAVEDENGNIPYEERNNIFMRFYRGKNSTRQEGLGIGLYLSREIVTKQGGYINFSIKGQRNRFSIMLFKDKE